MDVFIHPHFDPVYRQHPLVLADVGARGGLKKNWRAAGRHLRLLGFEPDRQEYDRLVAATPGQSDGVATEFFNVALDSRRGTIALNVARDAGLSSIFEPNRAFLDAFPDATRFDIVDRREVEADTLDAVVRRHAIDDIDFIKVDTQGSELRVLEGAEGSLRSTVVGVEAEVEFTPIYQGQPLFAEVDTFLRGLGFFLFDLRSCYWKREAGRTAGGPHGQIIWGDALYLKSAPSLQATVAALEPSRRASKALKAISVAVLYGYLDYALQLAHEISGIWTPEEATILDAALRAEAGRDPLPKVPGRKQMAAALHRLGRRVREPNDAWSVSDPELGNLE